MVKAVRAVKGLYGFRGGRQALGASGLTGFRFYGKVCTRATASAGQLEPKCGMEKMSSCNDFLQQQISGVQGLRFRKVWGLRVLQSGIAIDCGLWSRRRSFLTTF